MCKDRFFLSIAIIVFILLVEERCNRQWDGWDEDNGECGEDMRHDDDMDDSCGCRHDHAHDHAHDHGCGCGRAAMPMAHDPFSRRQYNR